MRIFWDLFENGTIAKQYYVRRCNERTSCTYLPSKKEITVRVPENTYTKKWPNPNWARKKWPYYSTQIQIY